MTFNKLIVGFLVVISVFSAVAFADYGYCSQETFRCIGGLGDTTPCATNNDCNQAPIVSKVSAQDSTTSLAADITLGVMGVATAAIITLVGFSIYAKGAQGTKVRKRRR